MIKFEEWTNPSVTHLMWLTLSHNICIHFFAIGFSWNNTHIVMKGPNPLQSAKVQNPLYDYKISLYDHEYKEGFNKNVT